MHPTTPTPRPPKRWRGPLLVVGIGVALLAVAAGLWVVGWATYGDTGKRTSREASDVRDRFATEVDVPGRAAVDLDAGIHRIYAVVPDGVDEAPADDLAITVTADDGTELELLPDGDASPAAAVFAGPDTDYDLYLLAEVDVAPGGGEHTVEVEGSAPGIDRLGLVAAVAPDVGADAVLFGGALYVGGLAVGGLGLLVGFVGGIWLLVVATSGRR